MKKTTLLLWKIGSVDKGWIPSKKHFKALRKQIKRAKLGKNIKSIVFHQFLTVDILKLKGK